MLSWVLGFIFGCAVCVLSIYKPLSESNSLHSLILEIFHVNLRR